MPPAVEMESSLNHWTTNIPHKYRHKNCSLLVYTQTIDFCYANPVPLLKSFISSKSFLVNSLVFPTHTFKKSAIDSFISSLLICMPFISLSCFIALARTSSTMLINFALFMVLVGKAFSFSWLNMMLAVTFSQMFLSRKFLFISIFESFYYE